MKWKKNLYSRQDYELRLIKRYKNALFRSNFMIMFNKAK
jgi:hypothetical protein